VIEKSGEQKQTRADRCMQMQKIKRDDLEDEANVIIGPKKKKSRTRRIRWARAVENNTNSTLSSREGQRKERTEKKYKNKSKVINMYATNTYLIELETN
jgi:hypothetical protein